MKKVKGVLFCVGAFFHFLYVACTFWMSHKYRISFSKDDDGVWYVDLPWWPFLHGNLAMVAGADDLCEFFKDATGMHAVVDVITSPRKRKENFYYEYKRQWAHLSYGGDYSLTAGDNPVKGFWLCQVTLFVIGWWPKYLYVMKSFTLK